MKKTLLILSALSCVVLILNPPWKVVGKGQTKPLGHNWIWNTGDEFNTFTRHFDKDFRILVYPQIDYARLALYVGGIGIIALVSRKF
jgi:hypothetical protein